jgi:hypothetical protein
MMNLNEARNLIAARYAKLGRKFDTNTVLSVHDTKVEAFDAVRGQAQHLECGSCGSKLTSTTLKVVPVDFTRTDAEYVVTRATATNGTCVRCAH